MTQTQPAWNRNTRLLHWGMAITVTFQLFSSLFMADQGTQYLFNYHEIIGVLAAFVVVLFWIYAFAFYELPILFPWNKEGMTAAWSELKGLFRGKLPPAGRRVGLSSLVHGLGLLALSGNVYTGLFIFYLVPPGHHAAGSDAMAFTHYSLEHKFFGELLWVYWIGHVAFALLHQFAGDRVLGGIFGFSRSPADES